jgi:hypothetical protein
VQIFGIQEEEEELINEESIVESGLNFEKLNEKSELIDEWVDIESDLKKIENNTLKIEFDEKKLKRDLPEVPNRKSKKGTPSYLTLDDEKGNLKIFKDNR